MLNFGLIYLYTIGNQNLPPNNPTLNQDPLPNTNVAQPNTNSLQANQPSKEGQVGGQSGSLPVNANSGQASQPANINKAENPGAKKPSGQPSIVDSSVNTQKGNEPAKPVENQNTNQAVPTTKANETQNEKAPEKTGGETLNPCASEDISLCFKLISEQMNKTEQLLNMANKTLAINSESEEPVANETAKPQANVLKPATNDGLPTNATQQNQVPPQITPAVSAPKATAPIVQNGNQQNPSGNEAASNIQSAPTNIQSPSNGQNPTAQKQPAPSSK